MQRVGAGRFIMSRRSSSSSIGSSVSQQTPSWVKSSDTKPIRKLELLQKFENSKPSQDEVTGNSITPEPKGLQEPALRLPSRNERRERLNRKQERTKDESIKSKVQAFNSATQKEEKKILITGSADPVLVQPHSHSVVAFRQKVVLFSVAYPALFVFTG